VRFAVDAVAGGDSAQAEAYLRLAVQKDAGLLDAHVLRAKVAVREGRLDDCVASLRATLDRGVRLEVLRSWIEQDPDLRRHLSDGRLAALGL
jgi:hypothetical protein